MRFRNALLGMNAMLLAAVLVLAGSLRAPLAAQTEPSLSPCCKTAIEGNKFCCADCCGSGNRCSSSCDRKKF